MRFKGLKCVERFADLAETALGLIIQSHRSACLTPAQNEEMCIRDRTMVVVEDWQEKAREISVRIRASGASARAVSLNDHASLPVHRRCV